MQRRSWLQGFASGVALSGCGFQLRGAPEFAFRSIYLASAASALTEELRRQLASNASLTVLDTVQAKEAEVVLEIAQDQREKSVVGVNATGQVREFQLRTRVKFRLLGRGGQELVAFTELVQQRDISFSESAVLSKESEEDLLYRHMQSDLVQQLMRRLAAVKL